MISIGLLLAACVAFFSALGVGALIAGPVYSTLILINSRQTISEYVPETHKKKQGTPTMGGLIIVAGVGVGFLVGGRGLAAGDLLLLLLFAMIGFTDDFVIPRYFDGKRGLGWKEKLALQIVAAALVAIPVFGFLSGITAVFMILFMSNAFNFVDGLDGLAGSVGFVFAAGTALIALLVSGPAQVPIESASVSGAMLPFLALNAPPAKLFMGDVGSLPVGAIFGLQLFELGKSGAHVVGTVAIAVAIILLDIVMIAELLPVPLQIASVKLRKKKLFLMTPIHHAFEAAGLPESVIVWSFVMVQIVAAAAALAVVLIAMPRSIAR